MDVENVNACNLDGMPAEVASALLAAESEIERVQLDANFAKAELEDAALSDFRTMLDTANSLLRKGYGLAVGKQPDWNEVTKLAIGGKQKAMSAIAELNHALRTLKNPAQFLKTLNERYSQLEFDEGRVKRAIERLGKSANPWEMSQLESQLHQVQLRLEELKRTLQTSTKSKGAEQVDTILAASHQADAAEAAVTRLDSLVKALAEKPSYEKKPNTVTPSKPVSSTTSTRATAQSAKAGVTTSTRPVKIENRNQPAPVAAQPQTTSGIAPWKVMGVLSIISFVMALGTINLVFLILPAVFVVWAALKILGWMLETPTGSTNSTTPPFSSSADDNDADRIIKAMRDIEADRMLDQYWRDVCQRPR